MQILGIVGQDRKEVAEFLDRNPLPFPILCDDDRAVIKAYGMHNRIALDAWNMAHPGVILIDREGVIRWIYRSSSQFDIPKEELVISQLAGLG